jgi:hypothetical protein
MGLPPNPLPTKGAARAIENRVDGKPPAITVKNAAGVAKLVSYDVETLAEEKALGFLPIAVTDQDAATTKAAKDALDAAAAKPIQDAAAAAQALADEADWKELRGLLLKQYRADKAAKAAAKPAA